MNLKIIFAVVLASLTGGAILFFLIQPLSTQIPPASEPNGADTQTSGTGTTTNPGGLGTTPSPYTLATVATHNSAASCWAAINGKVYNLTSWINQHPGGPERILSICGTDGSAAFNGQHGGDPRPATELAKFYLGELGK